MLEVKNSLRSRLKELRINVDSVDDDTLVLKRVPTHTGFFSKPNTNVLIKRTQPGGPFVVGVDEDLEYIGSAPDIQRAFAGGLKRQGWRVLLLTERLAADVHAMVHVALRLLGCDEQAPHLDAPAGKQAADKRLLTTVGTNLTELVRAGHGERTVGRDEETLELLAAALRWSQARLPLVLGESGVGKTNLLHAAAGLLLQTRPQLQLIRVDVASLLAGTIFDAERENLLERLFKEALEQPNSLLALEHLELALFGYGPLQLTQALDSGVKIIGTTLAGHLPRFQVHPLLRRLHPMELAEPSPEATMAILAKLLEPLAEHHAIEIDEHCVCGAVQFSEPLPGWFPAKAIMLLDAAAARASLAGAEVLALDDICNAASRCGALPE